MEKGGFGSQLIGDKIGNRVRQAIVVALIGYLFAPKKRPTLILIIFKIIDRRKKDPPLIDWNLQLMQHKKFQANTVTL